MVNLSRHFFGNCQVTSKPSKPIFACVVFLYFADSVEHDIVVSIPCTNVYDVHKLSKNSKDPRLMGLTDGIELMCSTLQIYKVNLFYECL